jgi:hypothetical protein
VALGPGQGTLMPEPEPEEPMPQGGAHSHWVHGDGPGPREIYGPDGTVTGIAWDGPSMCECVPGYASGRRSG